MKPTAISLSISKLIRAVDGVHHDFLPVLQKAGSFEIDPYFSSEGKSALVQHMYSREPSPSVVLHFRIPDDSIELTLHIIADNSHVQLKPSNHSSMNYTRKISLEVFTCDGDLDKLRELYADNKDLNMFQEKARRFVEEYQ